MLVKLATQVFLRWKQKQKSFLVKRFGAIFVYYL